MCGRYTLAATIDELLSYLGIDSLPFEWRPRYNIAPGQMIPAVIMHNGERRAGLIRWGLIPHWVKDEKQMGPLINARSETVTEKPAFSSLMTRKRCLIPADGFFEWKRNGTAQQRMRIRLTARSLFMMAGLYDTWTAPDGGKLHTCTILTTSPNRLMADIHNRMPVILSEEDASVWADDRIRDIDRLTRLLRPYPDAEMEAYPVDPRVGNVKNDDETLIRPL